MKSKKKEPNENIRLLMACFKYTQDFSQSIDFECKMLSYVCNLRASSTINSIFRGKSKVGYVNRILVLFSDFIRL